ncbi:MAG: rod shape-determining protein MreD [Chitinophagaceae bacterium]|nr:rod shape-determining protein MreD [Chitinophagaceae bacterium]
MSDLVRNILRFILFILVQVYILNQIPALHKYVIPVLYYLFILWLPFNFSRAGVMIVAFLFGLTLDYFMTTPGLHAAASVLVAYLRPFVVNILVPKDSAEFNYREPSPQSMGWTPYLVYALILTVFHHTYILLLELLRFGTFLDFLIKIASTSAISMLLIITTEMLFPRRLKYRTNTA